METWDLLVLMSPHAKIVGTGDGDGDVISEHNFPRVDLRLPSVKPEAPRDNALSHILRAE